MLIHLKCCVYCDMYYDFYSRQCDSFGSGYNLKTNKGSVSVIVLCNSSIIQTIVNTL